LAFFAGRAKAVMDFWGVFGQAATYAATSNLRLHPL
jgi:hypothetical protein